MRLVYHSQLLLLLALPPVDLNQLPTPLPAPLLMSMSMSMKRLVCVQSLLESRRE
jgi:hypothetical protein